MPIQKEVIENAKDYATKHKISLSKLVESYLQTLAANTIRDNNDLSEYMRHLSDGAKISTDLDYKKEYGDYLERKYT